LLVEGEGDGLWRLAGTLEGDDGLLIAFDGDGVLELSKAGVDVDDWDTSLGLNGEGGLELRLIVFEGNVAVGAINAGGVIERGGVEGPSVMPTSLMAVRSACPDSSMDRRKRKSSLQR